MIEIRDVCIGKEKPKICVPLCGKTEQEILAEAKLAASSPAEIIEWRVDFYEDYMDEEALFRALKGIRMYIHDKVLLFTLRTKEEGGESTVGEKDYIRILKLAIDSRLIDLLDVECCVSEYRSQEVISYAKAKNIPVLGSTHSFEKTLSGGEIEFRIRYIQRLGADMAKIAVMVNRKKDTFKLLNTMYELSNDLDFPIAIFGMGEVGRASRIFGEFFGSCITFGKLDQASAPGQIDVHELSSVIDQIHHCIN